MSPDTSVYNLSGSDIGWGINFSTVINAGKKLKFKLQGETGEGCQNYTADPSPDIALESNSGKCANTRKRESLTCVGLF